MVAVVAREADGQRINKWDGDEVSGRLTGAMLDGEELVNPDMMR